LDEGAQLLSLGDRNRQVVDQPVIVAVDDCRAVDMDVVRIESKGNRADAKLAGQFLRRRARQTNSAPVLDATPPTRTLRVRPSISPLASRTVTSRARSRQEIGGGDTSRAGHR